jgi:D-glycero-alpha-D-manno-heptose-7-phosphate kinase
MIITRSPLRLSLGGGGTDLPSYYRKHEGFVIAAAIDKYVYITLHQTFQDELIVKYSRMERVKTARELRHPIIRTAFELLGSEGRRLEITSMADIPAGTGLGSSGSFTTALLAALHCQRRDFVPAAELAAEACQIEIDRLGEPVGKQDQYIAAHGGLTCLRFRADDSVEVCALKLSETTRHDLEDGLLLFYTGTSRRASDLLRDQDQRSRADEPRILEELHHVKAVGLASKEALERGDLPEFAALMHEHWERKRVRSPGMSNPEIDAWYGLARRHGALGGKLVGAGGGGFLLFFAEDRRRLRHALTGAGLREVRFRFDFSGAKVLVDG